jgi:hypothetical protein
MNSNKALEKPESKDFQGIYKEIFSIGLDALKYCVTLYNNNHIKVTRWFSLQHLFAFTYFKDME